MLTITRQPANAGILAYLGHPARLASSLSSAARDASRDPATIESPYSRLGTHPDVVQRLWDELAAALPLPCAWVVFGSPVLAHPGSGAIIAYAQGTVYALRLPDASRAAADAAGASASQRFSDGTRLDLARIGADWRFGSWHAEEAVWCLAAFHAGADAGPVS